MFIGRFIFAFNIFHLKDKLDKCIHMVDIKSSEIPCSFTTYLIAAEDHRSSYHFGIDQIGMVRAFYVRLINNEVQGASTIEQQFVRVVTGDYTHSLFRKFKEQLLAIALSNKRSKNNIATAYLAIAYYGSSCEGTEGVLKLVGEELKSASETQMISLIARLKYPQPTNDLSIWKNKYRCRIRYIRRRHLNTVHKMLDSEENTTPI